MSFPVLLYILTGHPDEVDKSGDLTAENIVTGVLFEDVEDISTPYIEIDKDKAINPGSGKATFFTANYAYISQMNRYYFITGKEIIDNDHYVIRLEVDVLMSFQSTIRGTTFFVDRNQNAGSWLLPDGNVPINTEYTHTREDLDFTPFVANASFNRDEAVHVLGVADGRPSGIVDWISPNDVTRWNNTWGGVKYYALSYANLNALAEAIADGNLSSWFDDTNSGVFFVHRLPFAISTNGTTSPLQIGNSAPDGTSGYWIKAIHRATISEVKHLTIPSDFRRATSDWNVRMWIPGVGWQTIENALAIAKPYMALKYTTNVLTGATTIYLYAGDQQTMTLTNLNIVMTWECNLARQIPLTLNNAAEIARSTTAAIMSSALALGGAILTENPALIGTAAMGAIGNIGSAITKPTTYSQRGAVSGASTVDLLPNKWYVQYMKKGSPVLDDETQKSRYAARFGLMYKQSAALSSLHGKTVVTQFEMDVPSGCTTLEYDMIRQRLAEGVIL